MLLLCIWQVLGWLGSAGSFRGIQKKKTMNVSNHFSAGPFSHRTMLTFEEKGIFAFAYAEVWDSSYTVRTRLYVFLTPNLLQALGTTKYCLTNRNSQSGDPPPPPPLPSPSPPQQSTHPSFGWDDPPRCCFLDADWLMYSSRLNLVYLILCMQD